LKYICCAFRLPKDPERRKAWLHKIRRVNWTPSDRTVLCSKHFAVDDFEPIAEHRKKRDLKRSAIPSLFFYPDHLQPKQRKPRKLPTERSSQLEQPIEHEEPLQEVEQLSVDSNLISVQKVLREHDYCFLDAKTLTEQLQAAKKTVRILKNKLAAERKKSSYRKKKNTNLQSTLNSLKKDGTLESHSTDHLQGRLTPTLLQIFNRVQRQKDRPSTAQYSPEIRVFASTLQFYSTRAYEYVREKFCKALPDVSTIRKWFSNIDGSPGVNFTNNLNVTNKSDLFVFDKIH
jgi:hypothetical protein